MTLKTNTSIWVTGVAVARSKKAVTLNLLDKYQRTRTVILPLSLLKSERREGLDYQFQVPQWWAHKHKLMTIGLPITEGTTAAPQATCEASPAYVTRVTP